MAEAFRIGAEIAEQAFTSARYSVLGKLGIDINTIGTWDPRLPRHTRILVPVDLQAHVVVPGGAEAVVGVRGGADDPEPFEDGAPRADGVHLHWALPDALLRGGHDEDAGAPVLPVLPDQWVIVRALQPVGFRQVLTTGWVVDARTATVTPLDSYSGPNAPEEDDDNLVAPLNGLAGGVAWTASYAAAAGRFTLHDPLEDLETLQETATQGFQGGQAVYTVAGWWSDETSDPIAGAYGAFALDRELAKLGWRVEHDQDDDALVEPDSRKARSYRAAGLSSPLATHRSSVVGGDGRILSGALDRVEFGTAFPVDELEGVVHGESLPRYHTLLHGSVLGVPVDGQLPEGADDRPAADDLSLALGSDVDDLVAAFGAGGLHLDPDHRRAAEDLLAAFSSGLVSELGSVDGLDALGQREHDSGFWSVPGPPLPAARDDRLRREDTLAAGPMTVGRAARGHAANEQEIRPKLFWATKAGLRVKTHEGDSTRPRIEETDTAPGRQKAPEPEAKLVARAAPRYFRPAPFMLALRGARPSHRHHGDGLYDDQGKLLCRYPRTAVQGLEGVVSGPAVLPSLGSGAIPGEVLTLVREAVLLNPYGYEWLVDAGTAPGPSRPQVVNRVKAEMVRIYGTDGTYDGSGHVAFALPKAASAWEGVQPRWADQLRQVAAELSRFSAFRGVPPSPVAITTWRQPWVPTWVEWRVTLRGRPTVSGWPLDGFDLEEDQPGTPTITTTLVGRSLLGAGVGDSLRASVMAWLKTEAQRQVTNRSAAYGDGTVVQQLADLDHPLDLVSASLDGIREQLLGIEYVGQAVRDNGKLVASPRPVVLFGGRLRLDAVRLVDAFGRTLEVPDAAIKALASTLELEVADEPGTVRLRPRFQGNARWLWRLVDPRQRAGTAPQTLNEASVDQLDPDAAVNPVAGFLLPDHIDESLETFTVGGDAIGEVGHDSLSGAVGWEPAPGRAVPHDAGPLVGVGDQERLVAQIAAGLVRADAAARTSATPPETSALTAFLRAVDSTLWLVDSFASLGSNTLAGLVGRPIAVVRTSLQLEVPDDLAEVTVRGGEPATRKAAFDALVDEAVEAHLGTLTRADDTLLGYFLDDDYEHLHLVDKVVAEEARRSGRQLGQLGVLGSADQTEAPGRLPVEHPYLVTDRVLRLRAGQTAMLTLLMLPGGRVHLTSGILPRKDLQLAETWFTPGLKRLMPSVRVGPLLVDPEEVRLPLVSALGDRQTFTRRTGELTWKDDPILAATQTAYLPRAPHEVQEGWIRVSPPEQTPPEGGSV